MGTHDDRRPVSDMAELHRAGQAGELDTRREGQVMDRRDAAALGWTSGAPVDPETQGQFETMETHRDFRYLPRWEDLPARSSGTVRGRRSGETASGKEVRGVSEGLQEDFGVTHRAMRQRAGAMLDRAKQQTMDDARAGGASVLGAIETQPQGRDFYGVSERNRIAERGRQFGIYSGPDDPARPYLDEPKGAGTDFDTAAGMVAAMSPRVTWQQQVAGRDVEYLNIDVAEEVAYQEANPTGRPLSVSSGLPASAMKAADIYAGADPHTVLGGKKVESFHQNFTHPHRHDARTTVDTHMVNALSGLEEQPALNMLGRVGGYEAIDRAIREAGSERGLTPEETQSLIWHQQKRETDVGGSHVHGYTRRQRATAPQGQTALDLDDY